MNFEERNIITEETFGRFVKRRREQLGLSVRALAAEADLSTMYLSDIENLNRPAPRKKDAVENLAKALKLTADEEAYFKKAALASRTEDIDLYLKDNPRVCVALRMAQELDGDAGDDTITAEWERFITRLIELNSGNAVSDTN